MEDLNSVWVLKLRFGRQSTSASDAPKTSLDDDEAVAELRRNEHLEVLRLVVFGASWSSRRS